MTENATIVTETNNQKLSALKQTKNKYKMCIRDSSVWGLLYSVAESVENPATPYPEQSD